MVGDVKITKYDHRPDMISNVDQDESRTQSLLSIGACLQEETCDSLIKIDNFDADSGVVHSCRSITWPCEAFSQSHKLCLKEPPPSDWLALTSSNWTASVGKALDGDAVRIKKPECDTVSEKKQNTTCFDPDRTWSHSWNPSRQNVPDHSEIPTLSEDGIGLIQYYLWWKTRILEASQRLNRFSHDVHDWMHCGKASALCRRMTRFVA
jgi:hypothetical protein